MTIPARLSRTLHQALGDEAAVDLVNWMNKVDANRSELKDLFDMQFAKSDSRLGEQRHWTDARFADARLATEASIAAFREETRAEFTAVRADIARLDTKLEQRFADLLKWSFVFWVGAVGAIAALARVLR